MPWPFDLAQRVVDHRLVAVGLLRPFEAGRQAEGAAQPVEHTRVFRGSDHGRLQAGRGAAGEGALHLAHTATHARRRVAEALAEGLLQEEHAQVEGDRIEAAGKDDARAAGLRRGLVRVDHLAHPGRLAAQIDVVHAGFGTGGQQRAAVELVRPHGAEHQPRAPHQLRQGGGRFGVSQHQRRVGRRADLVAHRRQLVRTTPTHRPAQAFGIEAVGIALCHVLGHQPAGEAGGAVDDDVEVLLHGCLRGGHGA